VNFGVKWWIGFEGGGYIMVRVNVTVILGLDLKITITLRLGSCIYRNVCE
jgi:predicted acyltransferase (DUF342 family)